MTMIYLWLGGAREFGYANIRGGDAPALWLGGAREFGYANTRGGDAPALNMGIVVTRTPGTRSSGGSSCARRARP